MNELPPDGEDRSHGYRSQNQMSAARVEGPVVQTGPVSGDVIINPPRDDSSGPRVVPRQLPAATSHFTDHKPVFAELSRHMVAGPGENASRQRLFLITGEGGVGKTALVIEWAYSVSGHFEDGIVFCDLRGSHEGEPADSATLIEGLLLAFGVPPARIPANPDHRAAELRTVLVNRKALIVLDNAASAGQVLPLLPGKSGSGVIVTSRKQLMRLGEYGARRIRLDVLSQGDAVRLLREIMMAGGRQGDDEQELAELARLCAGLPLALRIAAERAISQPDMPLGDLLEELRDDTERLDALSTDEGNAIRAVFNSSYGRLAPDAARMFRQLGLHDGPEISRGAAAAAAGLPGRRARRALEALTQASLLVPAGPRRYRQHNLLRVFALDRAGAVDNPGDRRDAVDRIARWYTVTAHNASEVLVPGRAFELATSAVPDTAAAPDTADRDSTIELVFWMEPEEFKTQQAASKWFGAERPNLVAGARSAFDWGLWRRVWELALVLSPLYATYFTFDDWSVLSELAVTAAGRMDDPGALAAALDNRGRYLIRRGEPQESEAAHSRALALQEETGDEPGACRSLNALGLVRLQIRDLPGAIDLLERARTRSRAAGQLQWYHKAGVILAHALLESGQPQQAIDILEPLPDLFAEWRDLLNVGTSYHLMAWASRLRGDPDAARDAIDRAIQIAVDSDNPVWEGNWRIEAARVGLALGDTAGAARHCERAVFLQREVGDLGREATALDCQGEVRLAAGNAEGASECHREAAQMHRERDDDWQEAVALAHLARCEAELDHHEAAREAAARGQALVERFPAVNDPEATKISANLRSYLA